jgi:hypothetical protein
MLMKEEKHLLGHFVPFFSVPQSFQVFNRKIEKLCFRWTNEWTNEWTETVLQRCDVASKKPVTI